VYRLLTLQQSRSNFEIKEKFQGDLAMRAYIYKDSVPEMPLKTLNRHSAKPIFIDLFIRGLATFLPPYRMTFCCIIFISLVFRSYGCSVEAVSRISKLPHFPFSVEILPGGERYLRVSPDFRDFI
jgi:hypothetical protein